MQILICLTAFFFTTTVEAAGPTNWTLTNHQCQSKYESELIPWGYINIHNLSGELFKELGKDQSGWIDGRVQSMGCYGKETLEKCLRMKSSFQLKERKLPFVCVGSKSIDVNSTNVPYEDALKACNTEKFPMEGMTAYAIFLRIHELPLQLPMREFWIPNVEMAKSQDTLCTFISTHQNTVERLVSNCSIHRLGVCINNTYISDFQLTNLLEVSQNITLTTGTEPVETSEDELIQIDSFETNGFEAVRITKGLRENGYAEKLQDKQTRLTTDALLADLPDGKSTLEVKDLVSFGVAGLSFILSVITLSIGIVLWKRMNAVIQIPNNRNRKKTHKRSDRKVFKSPSYERILDINRELSTRVKVLDISDENPYTPMHSELV